MNPKLALATLLCTGQAWAGPTPKPEIRIAAVYDIGNRKNIVQESLEGIDMAVSDLIRQGYNIKLTRYDSTADSQNIAKAMESAIAANPHFIIAEADSSRAFIAGELAEHSHHVLLTPTATAVRVTAGKKYVFRMDSTGDYEAAALTDFALRSLGGKSAGIIFDTTQMYSSDEAKLLAKHVESSGGNLRFSEGVLPDELTFDGALAKYRSMPVDILFIPVYEELAAKIIHAGIKSGGFTNTTLIGGNGWATAEIFDDVVVKQSKSLKAYWIQHFDCSGNNQPQNDFAAAFKKQYQREPRTQGSILSYDAVKVGVHAVEGTAYSTDQDKIRQYLSAMPPVNELTGPMSFSGSQDPIKKLFIVGLKGDHVGFCKGA